ncbi:MAG TPA: enoyl-CoA hydratase, partial [Afipia sp.]|nr:enoyl-CoA hydratase [Afipia sp.]
AGWQDRRAPLAGGLVIAGKPPIAALPGPAAGAGLSLALACDLRIAAESAFVTTAYVKIGLSGDYGMSWLLTRLVGTSRARELMFFGEKIDAKRCEALGIVNRVVPDDKLREDAFAWAKKLAEGPTTALRFLKDNLDEALMNDFLTSLDHEAERMVRSAGTADHKEAVKAFVEKRKPVFKRS